ncbi:hypothetical protein Tco_0916063 [Tanacetum coccineum]
MNVVKGSNANLEVGIVRNSLSCVGPLSDECLLSRDLSKSLLGRVKEFASLANLKMALSNKGFVDIKIQYMGELWVMMEFVTEESIKLFRDNVSVGSWFSQIKQASMDFVTEGRIAWVEIEGIPFKLWSGNTFKRIAAKWGNYWMSMIRRRCVSIRNAYAFIRSWVPDFVDESDDEDQNDDDSKDGGSNVHEMGSKWRDSDVRSPDTYLRDGEDMVGNDNNSKFSMKYPPGFTVTPPKSGQRSGMVTLGCYFRAQNTSHGKRPQKRL